MVRRRVAEDLKADADAFVGLDGQRRMLAAGATHHGDVVEQRVGLARVHRRGDARQDAVDVREARGPSGTVGRHAVAAEAAHVGVDDVVLEAGGLPTARREIAEKLDAGFVASGAGVHAQSAGKDEADEDHEADEHHEARHGSVEVRRQYADR
jgi:hypothetical protein